MSSRAAQLAVELTEKGASQVAGGLDDVTSSAKRMGDTVESAGKKAKTAGDRMDSAAGGADEMASKGSQAAGAMSGLGDLIGGPFGAAMAAGGVGLQAMADSGDLLNAALENSVVSSLRAKAATIGQTVAAKASAVATGAMAVAQRALNLAMNASPVLLIVSGVLLLVGAITLAYKRSATFRAIVKGAMDVARTAVSKVVSGFKALGPAVQAVMRFVARVVGIYVGVYVKAFQLGLSAAETAWSGIKDAARTAISFVTDKVSAVQRKLTTAWGIIRRGGKAAFQALIAPVQTIIDLVQSLLDKIKSIHLPSIHVPGFGAGRAPTNSSGGGNNSSSSGGDTNNYNLTFNITLTGTASPNDADALMVSVDRRLRSLGKAPVFS